MKLASVRNAIDVMRIDVTRELQERTDEVLHQNHEYMIVQAHAKKYVNCFLPIVTEREPLGLVHIVATKDLKTQEFEAAVIEAAVNRFNLIDTGMQPDDRHQAERELWRTMIDRVVGGHGLVAAYSAWYHPMNDDMQYHTRNYIGDVNTNPHLHCGFVFVDTIGPPDVLEGTEELTNHSFFNSYEPIMMLKDTRCGSFPFKMRIAYMPLWCPWTALSTAHMQSLYDQGLISVQVYQQHRLENVKSN